MASAFEILCGQAFGAKKYYMLGVYLQRSLIVLSICYVMLLPILLFASPILKLLGCSRAVWGCCLVDKILIHFGLAFQFPLWRFLQCQLKPEVLAWMSLLALVVHRLVN
ncbi:hypothetical protein K1719_003671 [Acacia pycnantha]|nr:hypothetical protein K1719_003671 [Acacia pycnantha]